MFFSSTLFAAKVHWFTHGINGDNMMAMRLFHEIWFVSNLRGSNWEKLFENQPQMLKPVRDSCQAVNVKVAQLVQFVGCKSQENCLVDHDGDCETCDEGIRVINEVLDALQVQEN